MSCLVTIVAHTVLDRDATLDNYATLMVSVLLEVLLVLRFDIDKADEAIAGLCVL